MKHVTEAILRNAPGTVADGARHITVKAEQAVRVVFEQQDGVLLRAFEAVGPFGLEQGLAPLLRHDRRPELDVLHVPVGVVAVVNCMIGLITPPVGTVQFVGCAIGGISVGQVMRTILPFYGALIAALLLVTYVPVFSLGLPQLFLGGKF